MMMMTMLLLLLQLMWLLIMTKTQPKPHTPNSRVWLMRSVRHRPHPLQFHCCCFGSSSSISSTATQNLVFAGDFDHFPGESEVLRRAWGLGFGVWGLGFGVLLMGCDLSDTTFAAECSGLKQVSVMARVRERRNTQTQSLSHTHK